jgi:hypothetical protein
MDRRVILKPGLALGATAVTGNIKPVEANNEAGPLAGKHKFRLKLERDWLLPGGR